MWFFSVSFYIISGCVWQSHRAQRPDTETCCEKQRSICGSC